MRWRASLFAAIALSATSAAAADELTICADRPGKATATCTVPTGHWQVETGLADWSLQNAGGERDTSVPLGDTTLKLGLTGASDIEMDVTPWEKATSRVAGMHDSASGFGDINILYKQRLTAGDAAVQISALPSVKIPTAKHSLGNGEWEGGFLLPIGYAIAKTPLTLGFTPEIDWAADAEGHGHHVAMTQVADVGWQATNKFNLSAELWGQWDWDPAGTARRFSADASIAYLANKRVQLDAGGNFGLNRNTPDVELYAGVAKLF
jgi:hypothetical protein